MISIQNQLVGALEGSKVTLECLSEAYPKSINYWTKENGGIVPQGMRRTDLVIYETDNDTMDRILEQPPKFRVFRADL